MIRARILACLVFVAALLAAWPAQAQEEGNTAERVRIAWPKYDGTLTPYTFVERSYPLMTLVYDTLRWRGGGEWLALQVRNSEAGTRVTVRLREGARWHDGRPLTAEDVKFSYDYFAERYQPRFTPQLEAIESTEVVDELTVAFNLEHPAPGFSQPLSDVPILPRHLWEDLPAGETPPGLPVGSGPYRLVESNPEGYVFRANNDYFLGRPRVATLELPFNSDFEETVRSLLSREIDMIPPTLPEGTQEDVVGPSFETDNGVSYNGTALVFNLREAPFDSAQARRAVSSALDLRRITQGTVGFNEFSFAADRGYVHPQAGWASEGPLHSFDLERARSELAALDLPSITVLAPSDDPFRSEAGNQVVLALERAGADAELREVSGDELTTAVAPDGGAPSFEAAIVSIPPLVSYSPDNLRLVFGSDERQAPLNYSGYASEEFDSLAARAARETNPDERAQAIRSQLELLAQDDVPAVPLFYPEGAYVFRPSIYQGWTFTAGHGLLDKRSFLPTTVRSAEGPGPNAAPPPPTGDSGGGIGVGAVIALGMVGIVLLVIAVGVVQRARGT
jgi:peptide/nickel transport system substrate-binding protein